DHRIQVDKTFEKIRPLRNLELDRFRLILRAYLPPSSKNRTRDEERNQDLHQTVERDRTRDQIVLMITVAIALAVRVILIEDTLLMSPGMGHPFEALGKNPFSDPFKCHHFSRVRAFWNRVFRMRAVHIETPPIGQDLVELTVVIRI